MPTLFARRYRRRVDEVGRTEKILGATILVLAGVVVAAFVIRVTTDKDPLFNTDPAVYETAGRGDLSVAGGSASASVGADPREAVGLFPESGTPGWRTPDNTARFTPDNLYLKINGRADVYLQYHVVGLTFGSYTNESDSDRAIDVYWYDMGKPENALGMYQSELAPEAKSVSIGAGGYQVMGAVFFHKGGSYVQVMPTSFDESDGPPAMVIAERIAALIDADDNEMWARRALPQAGQVPDTFAYIASDAFSLAFLREVFWAEYDFEGQRLTLFIHRADDQASAEALLARYREFFEEYGRVTWSDPDESRRIISGDVAGLIDVVFVKGLYLGGVTGADDALIAQRAAETFHDGLAEQ